MMTIVASEITITNEIIMMMKKFEILPNYLI